MASSLSRGKTIFETMPFHVYILRLSNDQLYVGSMGDLARRVFEHQAGTACRTTALLRPVELLYSEPNQDRLSAVRRERQIKGWSRAKKLALIKGDVSELKRLAQNSRFRICRGSD